MKPSIIISILLLQFFMAFSQKVDTALSLKGDEDANMINNVKNRDQNAIEEAVNGWWKESVKTKDQRLEWWKDAKFGMFIHWGIYSLPGGVWQGKPVLGYAEHLMRKEKLTKAQYIELGQQFNPTGFNADEWVLMAKQAGMRYFIATAKHHDGFAMYDSEISDFNIVKQTPFKRDPMAELAAACRKHGIKFGFYYSHAFDWEHPLAPGNDWEFNNPGGDLLLHGSNWFDNRPDLLPNAAKYVTEKAIPQIKELLIKYKPDILWFDTPHKLPLSENLRIMKAIRETDPNVVVNGRLARSSEYMFGDYLNTGDRPAEFAPVKGDWESIPTTNESYGYSSVDNSHKSVSFFIRVVAKAAAKGGNTLLNIGPKGDGKFDQKDVEILKGIGKWMKVNGESIYSAKKSPLAIQNWGVSTQKNDKLYLHVFNWPKDGNLIVGGLNSKIKNAHILGDAAKKPLKVKKLNSLDLLIKLPKSAPDTANSVIVLETVMPVMADSIRLLSQNTPNRLLAFDAQLIGIGLGYADGKTNNYIVQNWKEKTQKLSWDIRLNKSTDYQVKLKYVSNNECAGSFKFMVNQIEVLSSEIKATNKNGVPVTIDLGSIKLKNGVHSLMIEPNKIEKKELMKLLEIELVPVEGKH